LVNFRKCPIGQIVIFKEEKLSFIEDAKNGSTIITFMLINHCTGFHGVWEYLSHVGIKFRLIFVIVDHHKSLQLYVYH